MYMYFNVLVAKQGLILQPINVLSFVIVVLERIPPEINI